MNGNNSFIKSTIRRGKKNALSDAEKTTTTTTDNRPEKKQKTTPLSSSSIPAILAALPKRKPIPNHKFANSNAVVSWLKIPFDVSQFEGDEIRIVMTNTFFEFFATCCGIQTRDIVSEIVSWIPVEDFFLASMKNSTWGGQDDYIYSDGAVPYFVAAILQKLHAGEWDVILPTIRRIVRNLDMTESLNIEKCPQYHFDINTCSYPVSGMPNVPHVIVPVLEWRHFCVTWLNVPFDDVSATPSYVLSQIVHRFISDANRSPTVETRFPFFNDVFEFFQVTGLAISTFPPRINSPMVFPLEIAKTFISRLIDFDRHEELAKFSVENLRGIAQWVERYHEYWRPCYNSNEEDFVDLTEWHNLRGITLDRTAIDNRMSYDFMKTWLLLEKHGAVKMGEQILSSPRDLITGFIIGIRDLVRESGEIDEDMPLHDEDPNANEFLTVRGVFRLQWQVPAEISAAAFARELVSPMPHGDDNGDCLS